MDDSAQIILSIVLYIYASFSLFTIARKTHCEVAFLAFVPILQVVPLVQAAGKSLLWILLLLIPVVNIVAIVLIWMGIAEQRGKSPLLGLLMLIPGLNLLVLGYLAFSD